MRNSSNIISKAQEFVTALASAPQPEDTPFVRNARPFAIYVGMIGLVAMGSLSVWLKLEMTAGAVVIGIGAILQQFGAQRSKDRQAAIAAATEDKKTVTGAVTATGGQS